MASKDFGGGNLYKPKVVAPPKPKTPAKPKTPEQQYRDALNKSPMLQQMYKNTHKNDAAIALYNRSPMLRELVARSQRVGSYDPNNPPEWMVNRGLVGGGSGGDSGGDGGWGGGGGYGGGGGGAEPAPVTWSSFDSNVKGAPSWWKAMKPSEMTEEAEFLSNLNMMIPFLSPEDQKTVASTLYQMNGKDFAHLNPEGIKVDPLNEIDTATQRQYTSRDRATSALAAMSELAKAVGKSDGELGPGYRYLRSILDLSNQFGATAGNGQTRRQYTQMMSALDPLYGQSKSGSLAPYGSLARMLAQPFFSGGQLMPVTKTEDGRYIFGQANKQLF